MTHLISLLLLAQLHLPSLLFPFGAVSLGETLLILATLLLLLTGRLGLFGLNARSFSFLGSLTQDLGGTRIVGQDFLHNSEAALCLSTLHCRLLFKCFLFQNMNIFINLS
jgi:hypothetical protein